MRARAALAGIALAACACATLPASIEPHLTWPIERADAADPRPRLGVGALSDERLPSARVGQRPPLALGWLGFSREGVERTGDDAYAGPVLEAARADLLATLARSGTFASVASVAFDPRAPGSWPEAAAPDYVLTGALGEFTGSQWRSFLLTPFRVGFVRDRFGAPRARVSASYELWTREGLVWQETVTTLVESDREDLADAVLEALARNDEKLALRLDRNLRPRTRPPRRLEVRVLDACALGAEGVRRLVAETSEVFERECEVALVAQPETWSVPADATDLEELLAAAALVEPPPGGVVLALAPAQQVRDFDLATERTGLAVPLGRHAVAVCPERGEASVLTASHELAHLFGAVHVDDPASIMNPTADFDARFFDPKNRRLLREARERRFQD
ncbi:MAG: hypothetical protein WEF50_20305 [Myxococcota bacterium]